MAVAPGATLELLVLSADGNHCAGVDMASGALVRAWSPAPAVHRLRPYDVVAVTLDEDFDDVPDPTSPRRWCWPALPSRCGGSPAAGWSACSARCCTPGGSRCSGMSSPAVPFWERRPDHPSIAVVEPEGPITLWREGPYLACRFAWLDHERELPCLDRRLAALWTGPAAGMVAGKGDRLLVALTPPIDGRCHKVVEAFLPRP